MKNPELACDWCGDEVANGEGVYVDDDRVCSECAAQGNPNYPFPRDRQEEVTS